MRNDEYPSVGIHAFKLGGYNYPDRDFSWDDFEQIKKVKEKAAFEKGGFLI